MISTQVAIVGETVLFAAGRTWFSIATIFFLTCFFAVIYLIGRRSLWLAAFVFLGAVVVMTSVSHREVSRRPSRIDVSHARASRHDARHESSRSPSSILVNGSNDTTSNHRDPIPVAWRVEVEERFVADKYASQDAAAKAFAKHVAPLVHQVLDGGDEDTGPVGIDVSGESFEEDSHLLTLIIDSMQNAFSEGFEVSLVEARKSESDKEDGDDQVVYVEVKKQIDDGTEAPWDRKQQQVTGSFATKVYGPDGHAKAEIRFVEKPWVYNFESYRQNHPGHLLIRAPILEPDRRDAERQSEELARKAVKPVVRDAAAEMVFGRPRFDVTDDLTKEIENGIFVRDQFTQELRTNYGTVWRHAMLVDLGDVKPYLTKAMANYRTKDRVVRVERRSTRHERSFRFGGLIALLASVCGIYWVLDTLTKGYFKGRVGVLVAVFGIVGLMLIFLS